MTHPPAPPDPRDAFFDTSEVEKGLKRKTGDASILILAMSAIRTVQQVAAIAILARLIPPAEYGVFALAAPVVMLGIALSSFGLPQAIVQRRTVTHVMASTLFWTNVAFGILAALGVAALAWPAAAFYDNEAVVPVFFAVGIAVLFTALAGLYNAVLRRQMRIRTVEIVTIVAEFTGLTVAIVAALAGLSYWALVLQQIVVPFVILVSLVFASGWLPSSPWKVDFASSRGAIAFGGYVAGASITLRLTQQAGTVIIGGVYTEAAAALFYRARNLANMPTTKVISPLASVLVPAMSRLQDRPDELREFFRIGLNRMAVMLFPLAVLLITASEPLTLIFLGRDWSEMAPILAWMGLVSLMAPMAAAIRWCLLSVGRSRAIFYLSLGRFAAVVGAIVIAAPSGPVAIAAAYVLTEILLTLPVMLWLTVRTTSLTLADFVGAVRVELALTAVLVAGLFWGVAPLLDGSPAILQIAAQTLIVGLTFGARVLASPQLRGELRSRIARRR